MGGGNFLEAQEKRGGIYVYIPTPPHPHPHPHTHAHFLRRSEGSRTRLRASVLWALMAMARGGKATPTLLSPYGRGAPPRGGQERGGEARGGEGGDGSTGRRARKGGAQGRGEPWDSERTRERGRDPGKKDRATQTGEPSESRTAPRKKRAEPGAPPEPREKGHHGRARAKTPNQAAQKPRSPRGMRGPTPSERLSNKDLIAQSR